MIYGKIYWNSKDKGNIFMYKKRSKKDKKFEEEYYYNFIKGRQ